MEILNFWLERDETVLPDANTSNVDSEILRKSKCRVVDAPTDLDVNVREVDRSQAGQFAGRNGLEAKSAMGFTQSVFPCSSNAAALL